MKPSALPPPVRSPFPPLVMPPPRLLFKAPIVSNLTLLKPYYSSPPPSRTLFSFAPLAMVSDSKMDVTGDVNGVSDPLQDPEDRTDTVITLYGDAISLSENDREAIRTAYLRRHPDAFWVDFGDFSFIRIEPKYVRYVSGVATALLGSGEFSAEEFKAANVDPISRFSVPIASHMNKDHAEDTKAIVQHSTSVKVDYANILDVDSLGFNVKAGYQGSNMKLRIPFPRRAQDRKDVKTLIVEMLQAAKAPSSSPEI